MKYLNCLYQGTLGTGYDCECHFLSTINSLFSYGSPATVTFICQVLVPKGTFNSILLDEVSASFDNEKEELLLDLLKLNNNQLIYISHGSVAQWCKLLNI